MPEVGIVGFGSMGQSLTRMCLHRGWTVLASVRTQKRMIQYSGVSDQVTFTLDNKEVARCATVILCVKPFGVKAVCEEIQGSVGPETVVICTAAIVPLPQLQQWLQRPRVIRCMPNVPCEVEAGIVPYYSEWDGAPQHMQDVFAPNTTMAVASDAAVNVATVISGCGPAFWAWFAIQLRSVAGSDLTEAQTTALITSTMRGTAVMLDWIPTERSTSTPSERVIKMVASPGGVTEAGLKRLAERKIDVEMQDTFACARERIHTLEHAIDPEGANACDICAVRRMKDDCIIAVPVTDTHSQ